LASAKLLLDIHSFPDSENWGLADRPDVVVLDNVPMSSTWTRLAKKIAATKLRVAHLPGAQNDIVQEARETGVNAILIEFREGLSSLQLDSATKSISDFFHAQ
jgi:hypothetical protein